MIKHFIFSVFLSIVCTAFAGSIVSSDRCPTPDRIKPCTCYRNSQGEDVVECRGLKSHHDIRTIFGRVPGWKFTILYVLDSTMLYFPSSIFKNSTIVNLNVTGSTMVSLFDEPPKTNALKHIFIESSNFQRGFRWDLVSTLDLESLVLQHTYIRSLGETFKNNIPADILYLWLEGNDLTRLVKEPFEKLKRLDVLVLKNQSLKKLKLLKFPDTLRHLDLGSNNLETLPEGFFSGLPNLLLVVLNNNKFSTMREETFKGIKFIFMNDNPLDCGTCEMEWIVTKKNPTVLITGKCASPSNLKGKELKTLEDSNFNYCG